MIRRLVLVLIAVITASVLLVSAQNKSGQDDDDFLNPAPNIGSEREGQSKPPRAGSGYDGEKVKDLTPVTLPNYGRGEPNHDNVLRFCKMIVDQIDNTERKENKIISISVKGFADGLKNNGVRVSRDEIHTECARFAAFDRGIDDIELANLRACQVEVSLRNLLAGRPYFVYVNFTMASPHDEPDGQGDLNGSLRKVEVQVTYLERK